MHFNLNCLCWPYYDVYNEFMCKKSILYYRFTSSINIEFVYQGQEVVTLGGGDYLWLYMNTLLVYAHNSRDELSKIPCATINLSAHGSSKTCDFYERLFYLKATSYK